MIFPMLCTWYSTGLKLGFRLHIDPVFLLGEYSGRRKSQSAQASQPCWGPGGAQLQIKVELSAMARATDRGLPDLRKLASCHWSMRKRKGRAGNLPSWSPVLTMLSSVVWGRSLHLSESQAQLTMRIGVGGNHAKVSFSSKTSELNIHLGSLARAHMQSIAPNYEC